MDNLKLYSRSEKGLDSLVQKVRVFSEDIGMEFGIEKGAMLVMEKGKIVKSVGIELPDDKDIKSLQEGESYKYLGILEEDKFLKETMKLKSIEDCVELAIRGLEVYVHGKEERLIQAARGDKIDGLQAACVLKRSKKEKRLKDWEEKVLHGQYLRQTKEVRSDQCWAWLRNGDLKR